jgi:hypothetical protein
MQCDVPADRMSGSQLWLLPVRFKAALIWGTLSWVWAGLTMKAIVGAALVLSIFALSGCVAGGVKVEERQLSSFEKGKTTYAQVVGQLGAPNATTLMPDGRRVIVYSYVQAQARPESFIPLVGAFVGGADSRSNMVSLVFTRDGVLEAYSSTEAQYGVGTGFASGNGFEGRTDQPRISADTPKPQTVNASQSQINTAPPAGRICTHDELNQARIARMNGYTGGPTCTNSQ